MGENLEAMAAIFASDRYHAFSGCCHRGGACIREKRTCFSFAIVLVGSAKGGQNCAGERARTSRLSSRFSETSQPKEQAAMLLIWLAVRNISGLA